MPSLTRFAVTLAAFGFLGYGILLALANFVEPTEREIVTTVALHPKGRAPPHGTVKAADRSLEQAQGARAMTELESMPFPAR